MCDHPVQGSDQSSPIITTTTPRRNESHVAVPELRSPEQHSPEPRSTDSRFVKSFGVIRTPTQLDVARESLTSNTKENVNGALSSLPNTAIRDRGVLIQLRTPTKVRRTSPFPMSKSEPFQQVALQVDTCVNDGAFDSVRDRVHDAEEVGLEVQNAVSAELQEFMRKMAAKGVQARPKTAVVQGTRLERTH
jgi:hypothetical protein